jgi:flagellar hook assembly protein FlgD
LLVTANGYNGVTLLDTQGVTPVHQTAIVPSYNQIHNYPNPFNPSTTISFNLTAKDAEDAKVEIFNVKGQMVKQLSITNDALREGLSSRAESRDLSYSATWNGTNADNKPVSSGVYFYKVVTSKATIMKKMLLLK